MSANQYGTVIVEELRHSMGAIPAESAENLADLILGAKRVYLAGAGRSGFMIRAFAMRLMHMGLTVHVVGEVTTPAIAADDLLLIGSGSGETASLVAMANKVKKIGAKLALVTIYPQSSIGKLADGVVTIPAPTPKGAETGFRSAQPMGSLFEQSLLLFFDGMVMRLMEKSGIDADVMFARHANLE